MRSKSNVLGIDIGSISISVVEISLDKHIIKTAYFPHHGDIEETTRNILAGFDLPGISWIAATDSTPACIKAQRRYNNQIALIEAARHRQTGFRSILYVGGEKFGLIEFDEMGNYANHKTNTSCATGTGSFLDQQARRLNLQNIKVLSDIAFKNKGRTPKIASRCSVFAKTDLIHAQQEGYLPEEICDGLCLGLARNIVDTVFSGQKQVSPVLFCGGVSKNNAVVRHIKHLTASDIMMDEMSHLYGAIGAALALSEEILSLKQSPGRSFKITLPEDLIIPQKLVRQYFYDPLKISLSAYPDFTDHKQYVFQANIKHTPRPVEVDLYKDLTRLESREVYLGIDIGSTSTKAVITARDKTVLAGTYTMTAGRPVEAICAIFEAIDDIFKRKKNVPDIIGCGTTGSGRKFAGKIIDADIVIDEISAHARAAFELNPLVDTIIEIGGQDAKFTTLRNGMVTFSAMNNVCAAGTGSFIEEQAKKLGCPLSEYSDHAENTKAPIASDRCTVFMERDINHYLNEGFSRNEALASALHSVRENYLLKVATESLIGNIICFQGATAKNRALVAAFEQRLKKPIFVSGYCHLTGALGAALILSDKQVRRSSFRGLGLYKKPIPIRAEVCDICSNHCKLTVADIDEKQVAYGFLCGRDYDDRQYVNNNRSGFNLAKTRKTAFSPKSELPVKPVHHPERTFTVGIPAALYLYEDLPLWEKFFELLSIKTISSELCRDSIKKGKQLTGAEFCAPLSSLYGHVRYLADRADYIFLPYYFENKKAGNGSRRQYCYYTQFVPAMISLSDKSHTHKFLMPVIKYLYAGLHTLIQLYKMVRSITGINCSFFEVTSAYEKALVFKENGERNLARIFNDELKNTEDISVVFLGRPYTVLNPAANNAIPDIFASLGIKTFYQDMVSCHKNEVNAVKPLLDELHWHYAAKIIQTAETIAGINGVYPVLITSFKCTPDSFIKNYFKKIMERHEKPYLVLELDELDSNVGYETRIEAAIRSFRNHRESLRTVESVRPRAKNTYLHSVNRADAASLFSGKTLVLPQWDHITGPFLAAILQREGIHTILMEESANAIQQSMKFNTGQCIPLNAIVQGFINCIELNGLDPSETVLWVGHSEIACNIRLYPYHTKQILASYGNGLQNAGVYTGHISFIDISHKAAINTYFAYMFGGMLRKVGCKIRPYEVSKGETDQAISKSISTLTHAFMNRGINEDTIEEIILWFEAITVKKEIRPGVAIFGDLYTRDNDVMNQGLIRFIEKHGGEAITTTYTDYCKMIAFSYFRKWFIEGKYFQMISTGALYSMMSHLEKAYHRLFNRILDEPYHSFNDRPETILSEFNISRENTGEAMDNILKIHYIKKHYPNLSLFVQASPAFCCPSLVTEAMTKEIERHTGVPVVSITYDGTAGNKNDAIIPYLKYPKVICSDFLSPRKAHSTK